jgi:hypothetical protein
MSISELERRRERRRDIEQQRRERALDLSRPDQILTLKQWCQLNGISERTGARILAGPDGPTVVRLSSRRRGVRVSDNIAWQDARARATG